MGTIKMDKTESIDPLNCFASAFKKIFTVRPEAISPVIHIGKGTTRENQTPDMSRCRTPAEPTTQQGIVFPQYRRPGKACFKTLAAG